MSQRKSSQVESKAWDILTQDEKSAITLAVGYNRSSWEAGEILKKSHYKYLEILSRATRFARLFSEYFREYDTLIPMTDTIPVDFREYINHVLLKRVDVKKATDMMDDIRYKVTSVRESLILDIFAKLFRSKDPHERAFADLLLEFDAWNNFRILPKAIQQPSAFKRRNKSRDMKNIRGIINIPEFSIRKIVDIYEYKSKTKPKRGFMYLSLVTRVYGKDYTTIKVERNSTNLNHISSLGLYLFGTFAEAEEFGEIVSKYTRVSKDKLLGGKVDASRVMRGQRFWPRFRELANKALNQELLNGLILNRKYLEKAYLDLV